MTDPIDLAAFRLGRRRASAEIDAWIARWIPGPEVCPRIMGPGYPGRAPPSRDAVRERRKIWAVFVGLVALCTLAWARPAPAITPVTPVGIPICDAFLAAYAQCAASTGVPEAVRPGLHQAIGTTREGLRSSAMSSDRARRTVEVQCAQSHGLIRERLVQAYGCDFPPPSPEAALLATQGRPASRR